MRPSSLHQTLHSYPDLIASNHGQDYYNALHTGLAYQQALAAGQTLAQATAAAKAKAAPAPLSTVERDLFTEAEDAMDKVTGWKDDDFFRGVVKAN